MKTVLEKLTDEQEQRVEEFVESVLENGKVELEVVFEFLGSEFHFNMPDQTATEVAMDEAGRDARGLRDELTRDVLFSRLILSKALASIDGYTFNEAMARRFYSRLQPGVVQTLFSKFVQQRELQSYAIVEALRLTKKSQPDPVSGSNGRLPE